MKIGVIGGTFDPVHLAHLAVAGAARDRLDLKEVVFVPADRPWFKARSRISPAADRVHMLRLALEGKPYFRISLQEIERSGPSYSSDTLAEMKKQDPDRELFFILGSDSLMTLPRWHEPERLLKICQLIVAVRPGYPPDIPGLEKVLPGISRQVIVLKNPEMNISSTGVRQLVLEGKSIHGLVPGPVEQYIRAHSLYTGKLAGTS